ncbi:MAG: hypothetical protein JXB34_15425 [Bacteroidales bacterium]|nr:hypothetical protein [Bacteroidales bacterium]
MKRYFLAIVCCLLVCPVAYSQFDTLCKAELLNYITTMGFKSPEYEKQTFYLDYSVSSFFSPESGLPDQHIDIKAYASAGLSIIESKPVSVYCDVNNSYAVMHDLKLISIGEGNVNFSDSSDAQKLFELQKDLIFNSSLESCITKEDKGRYYRYTRFCLAKPVSEEIKIKTFSIWFDTNLKMIYKVELNYIEGQPIKKQVIVYNSVNTDYKPHINGTAREKVFTRSGSLIPKYKGYTILNN